MASNTTPSVIYKLSDHDSLVQQINNIVVNPPHGCGSQIKLLKAPADKVFQLDYPFTPPNAIGSWDQMRGTIEEYAAENNSNTNPCGPIKWKTPDYSKARDNIGAKLGGGVGGPGGLTQSQSDSLSQQLSEMVDGELSKWTVWSQAIVDEIKTNLAKILNCRCGDNTCGTAIACPWPTGDKHTAGVHPSRFVATKDNGDGTFNGRYEWDINDVLRKFPIGPSGFCDVIWVLLGTSGADGLAAGPVDSGGGLTVADTGYKFSETRNGTTGDTSGISFFQLEFACGGFQLVDGAPSIRPSLI